MRALELAVISKELLAKKCAVKGAGLQRVKLPVRGTYGTASRRVGRATNALRGQEDSQILGKAFAVAIGVGIGVGIGLLIAPASGEETRADIAGKVTDFSDKVRENVG
jgi:hypothetical protein